MTENTLRIAMIGCGGISSLHGESWQRVPNARIVACADVDEEKAQEFKQRFNVRDAVTDFRRLLERTDIDAVDICIPTFLHAEAAIAAAQAGKHILCEKPIAMALNDADDMIGAARTAGVKLMVAFPRRFSAQWRAFRRIITQGEIGRPVVWREVDSGAGPLRDPRVATWHLDAKDGGGPFVDNWIHHYDFARLMFGEPVWAWANLRTMKDDSTSLDTGTCVVEFEAGDQLMISSSWGLPGRGHNDCRGGKMRDVLGPRGAVLGPVDGGTGQAPHFLINSGSKASREVKYQRETNRDWFRGELAHFAECVIENRELSVTAEDGRRALEIGLAILQSSEMGQKVCLVHGG